MNKDEIETLRIIMRTFKNRTGSSNKYRMAWHILDKYPGIAATIIKAKLLEISKQESAEPKP